MAMDKRLLDDLARMTSGALGAAASLREEAEAQFRERMGEFVYRLDLVPREEFDALRAVAEAAREAQEALSDQVAALEARVAALEGAGAKSGRTATAKSSGAKSSGAKAAQAGTTRRPRTARKPAEGAADS